MSFFNNSATSARYTESDGRGISYWTIRIGKTVRKLKTVSLPLVRLPFHYPAKEEHSLLPCTFLGDIVLLLDRNCSKNG